MPEINNYIFFLQKYIVINLLYRLKSSFLGEARHSTILTPVSSSKP